MDTKKLRQKILDLAIRGKLVPQDPNDEHASILLERIKAEKERLIKEGKIKRSKKSTKTSDTPHYENVPFEIPSSWEWTTLGEVFTLQAGKNITAKDISDKEDSEHRFPCYGGNGLRGYVCSYNRNGRFPLIGRQGALCGNINFAEGLFYATEHAVVVETYCKTDVEWAVHSLIHLNLNQYATSTAQPGLSVNTINEVLIPLPPIEEQGRIVRCLNKWNTLIGQIEQGKVDLQTTIKQTKSKILDLAIHGKLVPQDPNDEPASELLKRINPRAEFACDNGQYRNIPKNWCACKLVDICSFLSRGKSPKYSEDDKTYPVFAQKCNLKDGGVSLEQARFLDPSTINKWNEVYKLQTGDILVNSTGTGTVGRTRLFNTNCLGNYPFVVPDSHVSVVRVLKSICPQYIYAYISSNSIQQYMEENLAGSTNQKELYIGVLENMQIFLPSLAEQQRIVARIEELFSTLDNIQKALEA